MEIKNWICNRSELTPDSLGLIFEDKCFTFRELYEKASIYAGNLHARGIREGDVVGLLASNTPEMIFSILGLFQIGAKVLFLNLRLTSAELIWQVKYAEISWLITDTGLDLSVKNVINLPEDFSSSGVPFLGRPTFGRDEVATIMYTSGTTGRPKAVMHTYGNHYYSAKGAIFQLGLLSSDCWMCFLPLYHIGGLAIVVRSLICGFAVCLQKRFDPKNAIRAVLEHKVSLVSAVSTTLNRMLLTGFSNSSSLRGVLLGGGSVPNVILEQCYSRGIQVYQTYGLTETCSQLATLTPSVVWKKMGSAGTPLIGNKLKIVNCDGQEVSSGVSGEIHVKGAVVTSGYLYNEKSEAFSDGWFATGDIGYVDSDGYLFVCARRTDLIISGGENIYPAEVEAVLLECDDILEACVVGEYDAFWGEKVVAYVVLQKGAVFCMEKILKFCESRLAKYKLPKKIICVSFLPKTSTGKVLRRHLAEKNSSFD